MKLNRYSSIRVALGVALAALSISGALAAGEALKTGDPQTMDKWYGRAGGLVGADLITTVGKTSADRVGISYDQDVAKRTNMPREGAGKNDISITYDKDVASRTNMQRDVPPTQSAGVPANTRN